MFRAAVVIPVYNHDRYLATMVAEIVQLDVPCILVDDGSSAQCGQEIDRIVAQHAPNVMLVRHKANEGKGAAVLSGFRYAHNEGYTHGLQIDADGQHTVADIPLMLDIARANPNALIAGQPQFDESVPPVRLYMRYLTHYMVSVNTLTFRLRDAMCGFRVYPLGITLDLDRRVQLGSRMEFDIESLVRLDWEGVPIILRKTRVRYPMDGVSHFRMFRDNVRITGVHIRLCLGMMLRFPRLLLRTRHPA